MPGQKGGKNTNSEKIRMTPKKPNTLAWREVTKEANYHLRERGKVLDSGFIH